MSQTLATGILAMGFAVAGLFTLGAISALHEQGGRAGGSANSHSEIEVLAGEFELPYHKSSRSASDVMLGHFLREDEPDFAHMSMMGGTQHYLASGVVDREVYTVDLYVHETEELFMTKGRIYVNECTIEGDRVDGRIMYRGLEGDRHDLTWTNANDVVHLAVMSQRNCRKMVENGHLEAFKSAALAASGE